MKNLTKKIINTGIEIVDKYGYWSEELKNYYSSLDYFVMQKLDIKVKIHLRNK